MKVMVTRSSAVYLMGLIFLFCLGLSPDASAKGGSPVGPPAVSVH